MTMTTQQLKEHFDRMQMMCNTFKDNSNTNAEYLPEFMGSKSINDILQNSTKLETEDVNDILKILVNVDLSNHYNGSQWYDYKIHLNALLQEKGFDVAIF
jgi:hypothetical protein